MSLIYIALGGGLGAVSRFLLTEYINNYISDLFPFGTLSVNILGCFVIGLLQNNQEYLQKVFQREKDQKYNYLYILLKEILIQHQDHPLKLYI